MKMIINDTFTTSDINLAATLLSEGFIPYCTDKSGGKTLFLFKLEKKIEETVQSYWNRSLKVEPQSHFANIKMLKNQIYSS